MALSAGAPSLANQDVQNFAACLDKLALAAQAAGISTELTSEVLGALQFQPRVIELDRAQPEFQQMFSAYLRGRVTPTRVQRGRELRGEHSKLLKDLSEKYGVPGLLICTQK